MSKHITKPATIYVTKYALTTGIMMFTEEIVEGVYATDKDRIGVNWPKSVFGVALFSRKEAFYTLEEAQDHVKKLVRAKRKAIEKQLEKLICLENGKAEVVLAGEYPRENT